MQVLPDFEGFDGGAGIPWSGGNARRSSSTSHCSPFPSLDILARSLVSTRWESRAWGAPSSSSLRDATRGFG